MSNDLARDVLLAAKNALSTTLVATGIAGFTALTGFLITGGKDMLKAKLASAAMSAIAALVAIIASIVAGAPPKESVPAEVHQTIAGIGKIAKLAAILATLAAMIAAAILLQAALSGAPW